MFHRVWHPPRIYKACHGFGRYSEVHPLETSTQHTGGTTYTGSSMSAEGQIREFKDNGPALYSLVQESVTTSLSEAALDCPRRPTDDESSKADHSSSDRYSVPRKYVTIACDECRRRKTKCDGAQPCFTCHLRSERASPTKADVRGCRYTFSSRRNGKTRKPQLVPQFTNSVFCCPYDSMSTASVPLPPEELECLNGTMKTAALSAGQIGGSVDNPHSSSMGNEMQHPTSSVSFYDCLMDDVDDLITEFSRVPRGSSVPPLPMPTGPDSAATSSQALLHSGTSSPRTGDQVKRSLRLSQPVVKACDRCHKRKTKCDGKQPCWSCEAKGLPNVFFNCTYSPSKRKRPQANAKKLDSASQTVLDPNLACSTPLNNFHGEQQDSNPILLPEQNLELDVPIHNNSISRGHARQFSWVDDDDSVGLWPSSAPYSVFVAPGSYLLSYHGDH